MSEEALLLAVLNQAKKDLKRSYSRVVRRGLVFLAVQDGRLVPYKEAKALLREMKEHGRVLAWFASNPGLAEQAELGPYLRFPWNGRLARRTVRTYVEDYYAGEDGRRRMHEGGPAAWRAGAQGRRARARRVPGPDAAGPRWQGGFPGAEATREEAKETPAMVAQQATRIWVPGEVRRHAGRSPGVLSRMARRIAWTSPIS